MIESATGCRREFPIFCRYREDLYGRSAAADGVLPRLQCLLLRIVGQHGRRCRRFFDGQTRREEKKEDGRGI